MRRVSRECDAASPGTPGGGAARAEAKSCLSGCVEDACTNVTSPQLPLGFSSDNSARTHLFTHQKQVYGTNIDRVARGERERLSESVLDSESVDDDSVSVGTACSVHTNVSLETSASGACAGVGEAKPGCK